MKRVLLSNHICTLREVSSPFLANPSQSIAIHQCPQPVVPPTAFKRPRTWSHTLFGLALSRHISSAANEHPPHSSVLSILSGPPRCEGPLGPSQNNLHRAFLEPVPPNALSHIITTVGHSFLWILSSLSFSRFRFWLVLTSFVMIFVNLFSFVFPTFS